MNDWKILITDGLAEKGQAILREAGEVDDLTGITAEELLQEVGKYHAMVVRSRTKAIPEVIKAASNLKVIGRAGVGVDNINLETAKESNVTVVNSPSATSLAVAELAMGHMLALAREIPLADSNMKNGEWIKKQLKGIELHQKTLGVIGYGRIGASVGERAAAFGMTILGYDPLIPAEKIRKRGAEPVSLDDLLKRSDFITLHVPMTDDTRNLFDAPAFAKMKKGVRIVCTARGGIINEDALLSALDSGQVAGAALDVFAQEPPGLTALVSHPRVIATPHIAGQTKEAQERAAVDIATEILAVLKGDTLRWKIV